MLTCLPTSTRRDRWTKLIDLNSCMSTPSANIFSFPTPLADSPPPVERKSSWNLNTAIICFVGLIAQPTLVGR